MKTINIDIENSHHLKQVVRDLVQEYGGYKKVSEQMHIPEHSLRQSILFDSNPCLEFLLKLFKVLGVVPQFYNKELEVLRKLSIERNIPFHETLKFFDDHDRRNLERIANKEESQ